jgi:hypothetical protein
MNKEVFRQSWEKEQKRRLTDKMVVRRNPAVIFAGL